MAEIWIRDYAEVHKAPSSVIRDRQVLRDYLNPHIGKQPIHTISRRDLMRLQAWLQKNSKLAPKTINSTMSLVHKILADAVYWDYINTNPAQRIRRLKCPEVDYRFWTFADRDKFLKYCKSRNPHLHDLVAFACNTGLRRGEVEGLLRDCLDFDRREIIVKRSFCHKQSILNEHTKGKTIRRVPMNSVVYEILKDRQLLPMTANVFQFDFEHIVWRHFKPLQAKAEVPVVTFHDLRHTFASHLAMSGVSLFDIQKLLGHSDIKTTMRYMHLAPGQLQGKTDVLVSGPKQSGVAERSFTFGSEDMDDARY